MTKIGFLCLHTSVFPLLIAIHIARKQEEFDSNCTSLFRVLTISWSYHANTADVLNLVHN